MQAKSIFMSLTAMTFVLKWEIKIVVKIDGETVIESDEMIEESQVDFEQDVNARNFLMAITLSPLVIEKSCLLSVLAVTEEEEISGSPLRITVTRPS